MENLVQLTGQKATFDFPRFPQVSINIFESWANFLSSRFNNSNDTIINSLMQVQIFDGDSKITATSALTTMVTNDLARIGFLFGLQGKVKTTSAADDSPQLDGNYWLAGQGDTFIVNASEAENWTKLHMLSTLKNHTYNAIGKAPKVAIAVITTYCIVVVCHVIYASISGTWSLYYLLTFLHSLFYTTISPC